MDEHANKDSAQPRNIVPTFVYKDGYLHALRELIREGDAESYVRMLSRIFQFTAGIDFSNLAKSEE